MTSLADLAAAAGTPGASAALVRLVASGGAGGLVEGDCSLLVLARDLPEPGPGGERPITVDQTHTSVVVDETARVKWVRPGGGPHPAPRLLAHLAAVGFGDVPEPWAVLSRGRAPLAFVDRYLPGAVDGWEWCVEHAQAVADGGEDAGFPEALGELVGRLVLALATPSPVVPDPVGTVAEDVVDGWRRRARRLLASTVDREAARQDWDPRWADQVESALHGLVGVGPVLVQPVHGDLHVGQVLRWSGGLAVTDFDGNPVAGDAGVPQPAARDVAQLLASLEHVARVAARRTDERGASRLRRWAGQARQRCLGSCLDTLAAGGRADLLDQRLLWPFMVEQELRELDYAEKYLPRWRYAPVGTLRSWFDSEGEAR